MENIKTEVEREEVIRNKGRGGRREENEDVNEKRTTGGLGW